MTLSEELTWRGFINQTTLRDKRDLDKAPITFYWGVDPSASSMHIGNLAMAMMVRHFIAYGHKAILLVGGATGMIGDPDGKLEERELKSKSEVAANAAGIVNQYKRLFAGLDFEIVDNYDWFKDLGYLNFLRDVGKHFSMSQLLDREFVKSRIGRGGSGISYAEFSYSLIQGYDFWHLFRTRGVTLQVAGSDQWGNSISGVELIRKLEAKEAHVWTAPLIMNAATGRKFGKSENGAVWLDEARTSVFEFYQFWLNTDDKGVIDYIKIFTLLPKERVTELAGAVKTQPAQRLAQKTLAFEVTRIVHGEPKALEAQQAAEALHKGQAPIAMPSFVVNTAQQDAIELLVKTGLATSSSEARRLLAQGGVKLNQQKLESGKLEVEPGDVLRVGKRRFIRLDVD